MVHCVTVLDATGKPPSGLLQGALTWPGLYTQCRDIRVPAAPGTASTEAEFGGQYCTATVGSEGAVYIYLLCNKGLPRTELGIDLWNNGVQLLGINIHVYIAKA